MTHLTRDDELYIVECLLARARRKSKSLQRGKPIHPEVIKHLRREVTRCTRIASLLQRSESSTPNTDARGQGQLERS